MDQTEIKDIGSLGNLPDRFNLLFYGSKGITNLAEQLGLSWEIIERNAWAVVLSGYNRYFSKWSDKWQGGIATIRRENDGWVAGIMLQIVKKDGRFYVGFKEPNLNEFDMTALCKNEAMHVGKYFLQRVDGVRYKKKTCDLGWTMPNDQVWAFVVNENYVHRTHPGLNRPSDTYIKAIQEMLLDRRELSGQPRNERDLPNIDVRLC
jgi:hypothetical protein